MPRKVRLVPSRSKYGSQATVVDGMRFDSKLEASRYMELKLLQLAGEVDFFLRQVPFHLPGGVTYRVDFQIVWADGRLTFEDTKGYMTKTSKMKIKQVEALYPVHVEIISSGRRRSSKAP